jgi:S1-C subfamily serine protease
MKRLFPILLLVFSVGVGDVYGGDRDSSPEVQKLVWKIMDLTQACKPRERKRLTEQLLFSTDGTIVGKLGDDAIVYLTNWFFLLYDPIAVSKLGANCVFLPDEFRSDVWASVSYHYKSSEDKRRADESKKAFHQKYGNYDITNFAEHMVWSNRVGGINPHQRASAANDIIDRIERTRTIRAKQRSGSSAKKKSGGTGTGFFINKQGHIVTNSHVVKDCKQINTLYQGSKVSTSLVTNDPRNDLALLKASVRPRTIAYFRSGRGIRAGEDILAFGYPLKSVLSDELKGTKGMINALSGLNNDTRFMQMSAPVQAGNSGGPLLDQRGNVVGVVTAKLNAVKMAKYTGDIPQNVNFALKASLVRDMLEVKDIDYETASSKKKMETVDIFDKAKKFTVLVECESN